MNKILVIDDEEWLREMVSMALQQKGFDVMEASGGAAGIDIARKHLPDLILCDVNMDKVDGYLTLSALRNEPVTASIPFILMTGLADNAGMRHGMELGADDYLPKPFTLDALYAAVDARLKKVQAVRQEAEKKLADLRDNISLMLPHELRTPLNGILAFGEILAADSQSLSPAEVSEMGQSIYDSGKRLERLVENFLIYAQIELLGTDPQKLRALRAAVCENPGDVVAENSRREAEKLNRVQDLELNVLNTPVRMSPDNLGKVVSELVSNALKFSSGNPVTVSLSEAPDSILLQVEDRGRGFQTEHLSRIGAYMQFERKIHEQQGLGLGLAIAKRLVEIHGGSLIIQSERAQGTTVSARLPKAA